MSLFLIWCYCCFVVSFPSD